MTLFVVSHLVIRAEPGCGEGLAAFETVVFWVNKTDPSRSDFG